MKLSRFLFIPFLSLLLACSPVTESGSSFSSPSSSTTESTTEVSSSSSGPVDPNDRKLEIEDGKFVYVLGGVYPGEATFRAAWDGDRKECAMEAASINEITALDPKLGQALKKRSVEWLYSKPIRVVSGKDNANYSWALDAVKNDEKITLDGGYCIRAIYGSYDEEADFIYPREWLPDVGKRRVENLSPSTLYMPPWQETPDEYGMDWSYNPAIYEEGSYTFVVAKFNDPYLFYMDYELYGFALIRDYSGYHFSEEPLASSDENLFPCFAVGSIVNGKRVGWSVDEESRNAPKPCSLAQIAEFDPQAAATLQNGQAEWVYGCEIDIRDPEEGDTEWSWTTQALYHGKVEEFSASHIVKAALVRYDEQEQAYYNDAWVPNAKSENAENLTPETLWMPPFHEEADEYGLSWFDMPVVYEEGYYFAIVAKYPVERNKVIYGDGTLYNYAIGIFPLENQ